MAIASIGNVVANLLLIPRYGAIAACWTTVATEYFVSLSLGSVSSCAP